MTTIAGLSARLIAPRLFPTRRWFASTPLWYYHAPRRVSGRRRDTLRVDARFFARVDPELVGACRLLLAAGLRTTPSCQGHFYPRPFFAAVWDDLVRERRAIRGDGLVVVDAESHERVVFRDPAYRVPWSSFTEFEAEAAGGQSRGYLGIVVPAEREALLAALDRAASSDDGAGDGARLRRERSLPADGTGALFALTVEAGTIAERRRAWARATERLSATLRAAGVRRAAGTTPSPAAVPSRGNPR